MNENCTHYQKDCPVIEIGSNELCDDLCAYVNYVHKPQLNITAELLQTIKDFILSKQDDVIWITGSETVLDRLVYLYLQSGGDISILCDRYPDMF